VPDDVKHDTPGNVIKQGQPVHIDVDLALVNVTVTDPYNRLVTGLEPDNFRIFENNVEQEIQYFSAEDVPISIGVIFDLSGSMANKVGKAKEAALQFFKTANPQDEFFLVSFNDRAEVVSTFTSNVEDLQSGIVLASAKGAPRSSMGSIWASARCGLLETPNGPCSSSPTGAITIASTTRRISSGWCERQIPSFTRSAYLT
jgi:VWFA-related protein